MPICDYGCNRKAVTQFNNGKWCCSEHANSCPGKIKISKCNQCGIVTKVHKHSRKSTHVCNSCNSKDCRYCGQTRCQYKWICKKYGIIDHFVNYFGLNKSTFGTINFYTEFFDVCHVLKTLYYEKQMSALQIAEKYNYPDKQGFSTTILQNIVNMRSLSESNLLGVRNGTINLPEKNTKYNSGHHLTWNGKNIFYRSSYELKFAKKLDNEQINYDVEALRINYWDTQKQKTRTAVPDFYLSNLNKIIEIKSDYTFDKQRMIDKATQYKNEGYEFELILENNKYTYEDLFK